MSPCEVVPCTDWVAHQWGLCHTTGDCGGGMMSRVVYCVNLRGGWYTDDKCTGQPLRRNNCTVPCPNDCVLSEWGSWGACSQSCGIQGGVKIRKRSILAYPSSLRPPCPAPDKLVETQKCNVGKLCEDDVSYMWKTSTWGPCEGNVTSNCVAVEGVQKREVYCGNDVKDFENDTQCGNITKPSAARKCDVPCPRDCVLSEWESWSKCNATCHYMQGIEVSKRYVLQQPEHGGLACPTGMISRTEVKTRKCWNSQPCYNYTWSVTPWQACVILPSVTPSLCGAGYQIRNISCTRSDGKLVETSYCFEANLELPPKTIKECWKPCKDDCVRTSWSAWSDCPNKCSSIFTTRDRRRQVISLSPARGGFSANCPKLFAMDLAETENCPEVSCGSYKWYVGEFASCIPHDSLSGCGKGIKERHVFCQQQSDFTFVSESFCDGSKKPSTWENCVTECPQDCAVSSWGKWDLNCSHTCGDTLKTRQRVILQQPQGLGRSCPSLVDKRLCREKACTSFKWKVGIWNTCKLGSQSGVCGNGTQTREVTCSPDPAREWICQKQAPKPVESQDCALACPGDCVTFWYPWSDCVQGKDGCMKGTWENTVRQSSTTSLRKCSSVQIKHLAKCPCPSAGKVIIGDWSTCAVNQTLGPQCGKGMQYRSVKCEDDSGMVLDKSRCSNHDATLRSRECEIPCPVDCVMGEWSEWSSCTAACGLNGKIERSRPVILSEQNGGRKCPDGTQFRPCDSIPCYNYALSHGAWGKCYVDGQGCGDGSQSRETTCRRSDGKVVGLHFCYGQLGKSMDDAARLQVLQNVINNSSQLAMTSTRRCEVSCLDDCFMSDWSEWSECGRNCFGNSTKYYQTRSRVVISSPNAGGKACSTDLLQTQECVSKYSSSVCIGAEWRAGTWQANGTRAVWCETLTGVRVTGACAERKKPSERTSCNPACADSNSICDEGQCRCKSNYEPFQGLCIPTQGCLRDGHCINERNVCKNEKCACGDGYSWNTTVESCVLAPKTSSDKPKTVSKNVKRTSTVASTTENVAKEAVEGKDGAISPEFWKWIGIGIGALVFFLVLAIGFYCYSRRQRKAKHRMMRLKRNTIELVGVLTFGDDEKLKPDKV